LRQFRPLRAQHRALFMGSAGAQMHRKGAVPVGGALLNLCLGQRRRGAR
jgi:predicted tellurium resistance membrane protein TerC